MVRSHPKDSECKVSFDSKMVCLWFTKSSVFTAELNLELKPQENNIKISLNLYMLWSHPQYTDCNWFWGDLLIVH
jgi:hypothetical protein